MLRLNFYDFQKKSTIDLYSKYVKTKNITNFKNILIDKTVAANFWIEFLNVFSEMFIRNKQQLVCRSGIDYSTTKKCATFAFLKKVVAYSTEYIGRDIKDCFYTHYETLEYVEAVSHSTLQTIDEHSDKDISFDISSKILNAPIPFNDKRFKVLPMHSNSKEGLNRSNWLLKEKGTLFHNITTNQVERTDNCYNTIFLDTKLAILIFFKNLPSITVSFYFDNNKNIYVQQIQSQRKDRGHYKLKGNWRNEVLNYIISLFPNYNVNLITGESVQSILIKQYKKSKRTISQKKLDFINGIYDNILNTHYKNIVNFNDFSYIKANS